MVIVQSDHYFEAQCMGAKQQKPYSRQRQAETVQTWHLFLANDFASQKFFLREAWENRLSQFFANTDGTFYECGNTKLPAKWPQVIKHNSDLNRNMPTMLNKTFNLCKNNENLFTGLYKL